jgi:hypothetical protein
MVAAKTSRDFNASRKSMISFALPRGNRASRPAYPRFELALGDVFARLALAALAVGAYRTWRRVEHWIPPRLPGRRLMAVAFLTPRTIVAALFCAAVATVVIDLVFRLLVRPLMVKWYHPRSRDPFYVAPLAFDVGPRERLLAETPARRIVGRLRQPGVLVRTDRRVGFFPYAWDAEPWTAAVPECREVAVAPTARRVLGLVRGYPDHVEISTGSGEPLAVIVADPSAVFDWFRR